MAEIEAIKRLSHPNIVKLIDHSALDDPAGELAKQYLVMPIASGGDLGDPGRVSLYADNIDSTVHVAKQIAAGLEAAHLAGIVHRDIKPGNILSTGNGHEIWIADFGICHLRESERITPADEVVGPRAFMAPELEYGGQLDVTAAADVYSLGKLIYFMLSGGTVLPRELLHEPQYRKIFAKGERYTWLEIILRKMICPLPERYQTMTEVLQELSRIESWEATARALQVSSTNLAMLDQLQAKALTKRTVNNANEEARERERASFDIARRSVADWLRSELGKRAALFNSDVIGWTSGDSGLAASKLLITFGSQSRMQVVDGVSLTMGEIDDPFQRLHSLHMLLCRQASVVFMHGPELTPRPYQDPSLILLPCYVPGQSSILQRGPAIVGHIRKRNAPGPMHQRSLVSRSFDPQISQNLPFLASAWPENIAGISASLEEAIEAFLAFIDAGAHVIDA